MSAPYRRKLVRGTALAATLVLALTAACSSDSSDDSATSAGDTTSAAGDVIDGVDQTDTAGTDSAADSGPLTIYTGQHEDFVQELAAAFTAATGIEVAIRAGDDAELANQLLEEGAGSPADLFLTEEPGPIGLVDGAGLLAPVDPATLAEIDQRLLPSSGNWIPYAARARVIYYDPAQIAEADLPESILDLTDPKWAGRFAYAPSGAFASSVSYLIATLGEDATLDWLKGIKANGINEQKNGKVRDSVEAGQHEFGLSNHYYWHFLAADKGGADNMASKVYYFDHEDAGGLLLPSGAGILASSAHTGAAQRFLAWLGAADAGQQVVAGAAASQFPVAPGVDSQADLPSLADIAFPTVDASVYADPTAARELIIKAGIA